MSCTEETVVLSRCSLLTKAVLVSPLLHSTVGSLMKIYCAARSVSSLRLAIEFTSYFSGQSFRGNNLMPRNCEMQFQHTKPEENIHGQLQIAADQLLDYGRKMVADLIQQNAPESLQESEILRTIKSALGIPRGAKCSDVQGSCNITWSDLDKDGISSALWHVAEERWNDVAEKISLCKPEKVLNSAVELVQERIKDVIANNSLVSQIVEAGDYLTATTKSLKTEAETLSQQLFEKRDNALANATVFWKTYCENHTTLETLHSLVDDFVLSHINFEGLELLSEFIWTMRPEFNEVDFMELADYPQVNDDGFHFMVEDRVPRRSILFIGRR